MAHHEFEVNGSPSRQRNADAVTVKWCDLLSNEISCLVALLRVPVSPFRLPGSVVREQANPNKRRSGLAQQKMPSAAPGTTSRPERMQISPNTRVTDASIAVAVPQCLRVQENTWMPCSDPGSATLTRSPSRQVSYGSESVVGACDNADLVLTGSLVHCQPEMWWGALGV